MFKKRPANTDTRTLIKACLRHDRRAEEIFYKQHFADAYRTCNRYLPQHADSLSVVNEGFLKVFQNLKNYDTKQGHVKAWIHRIMVNTAIDHLRKEKRHRIKNEEIMEKEAPDQGINEGFYTLEADELLQMIKQLPTITRTVFNFIAIEGYTHKEIAGKLDITEGTSRWHLSEARKRLKQCIRQQEKIINETRS